VTKAAAGEHRKITEPARSPGVPQRFIGVRLRIASDRAGSSWSAWVSGVAIQPGAMALTRMPSAAQEMARLLVSCDIPPLLAL
jgi:hypothetical protein